MRVLRGSSLSPPTGAGGGRDLGQDPTCLPAGTRPQCSVSPRAHTWVQYQWLADLAPFGGRGSSCFEASHLPSACSPGRGCACASVCVAECITRVCGEGRGEHGVSHFTTLCQAPSAAPFFFALNGLSKDPLSRAAESFLHFKKKKEERSEFLLGQY